MNYEDHGSDLSRALSYKSSLYLTHTLHAVALDGSPVEGEFVSFIGADNSTETAPQVWCVIQEGITRFLNRVIVF